MKQRVIALVDCDCFFVSCERVDNPALNGRPVCVMTGGGTKGIVVSRSAEAKALGIKMGAPMFQVQTDYPQGIYIPSRLSRYADISARVMAVLRTFSPDMEEVSIDEAYMDLTGLNRVYRMTHRDLIARIRQTVWEQAHIPVSIGLATTKTLAKLASDKAKKTGGLFLIPPDRVRPILRESGLEEVCGISRKTALKYWSKGVTTPDEFLDKDVKWIRQAFGVTGERLWYELSGLSVIPVNPVEEAPKSIQDTHALEDITDNPDVLENTLYTHVHRASRKLRTWDGYCGTVGVVLRTKDFQVMEQDLRLERPTNSENTLLRQARVLLHRLYRPRILYRATGITLKDLVFGPEKQPSLFGATEREDDKISRLIDTLEQKFGKSVLKYGA